MFFSGGAPQQPQTMDGSAGLTPQQHVQQQPWGMNTQQAVLLPQIHPGTSLSQQQHQTAVAMSQVHQAQVSGSDWLPWCFASARIGCNSAALIMPPRARVSAQYMRA